MKMLGHHHISDHDQPIAPAHPLQHSEKKIATPTRAQHREALIATASDEVQITRAIKTLKKFRHRTRINSQTFSKM
jgi:hypothetical protein